MDRKPTAIPIISGRDYLVILFLSELVSIIDIIIEMNVFFCDNMAACSSSYSVCTD